MLARAGVKCTNLRRGRIVPESYGFLSVEGRSVPRSGNRSESALKKRYDKNLPQSIGGTRGQVCHLKRGNLYRRRLADGRFTEHPRPLSQEGKTVAR
jgi:hypothetical protein